MSHHAHSDPPRRDDIPSDDLLAQYVAEECTPEERDHIERWAAGAPRNAATLDAATVAWTESGRRFPAADTDHLLDRVHRAIAADEVTAPSFARRPVEQSGRARGAERRYAVWMAGAAALVIGIAFAGRSYVASRAPSADAVSRTYTTTKGQRATVLLADGSRVQLGVASMLRYQETPNGARTVTLDGEAYFDVAHDPRKPFTVLAGATTTRILGTRFVVRKYNTDPAVRVAVVSGRVALQDVPLGAGDVGETSARGVAVSHRAPVDDFLAWSRGQIVFRDQRFGNVLAELSRWYDVDFVCADARLANEPVSSRFTDASLDDVVRTLALSLNATVRRTGRTITFSSARSR